jgi:hypothetical protein
MQYRRHRSLSPVENTAAEDPISIPKNKCPGIVDVIRIRFEGGGSHRWISFEIN